MPSNEFVALLESIETKANEIMPQDITVEAQAGLHTVLKADQDIVNAQLGSLSITLVTMFCVMAVLWRSFRFSAIALATGLGPIAVLTIIGALFQIPLNSVTVMVGAIALGIGIDDAGFSSFLDWVLQLRETLDIPQNLEALGIDDVQAERVGMMAEADPSSGTNPILFSADQYQSLFLKALKGNLG